MKRKIPLLPQYFKWIGVLLLLLSIVVFIIQTQTQFLAFDEDYEIVVTGFLLGLLCINFVKEKIEDERIQKVRLMSWSYSFYLFVITVFFWKCF